MRTRIVTVSLLLLLTVFVTGCGTIHMGIGARFNQDGSVNASIRLDTTGLFAPYIGEISKSMDTSSAAGWEKTVQGSSVIYQQTFSSIDALNSDGGPISVTVDRGLFSDTYHFSVRMPEDFTIDSLRASVADSGQTSEFISTDDMVSYVASCISVGVEAQLPDGTKIIATNAPQSTKNSASWNLALTQLTSGYAMTLDWQKSNPTGYILIAVAAVIAAAIYFSRRRKPSPAQPIPAQPTQDVQPGQAPQADSQPPAGE